MDGSLKERHSIAPLEQLLLAIIGEQFDVGSEICGAGVVRNSEDIISVRNKNADNKDATNKIRDSRDELSTALLYRNRIQNT